MLFLLFLYFLSLKNSNWTAHQLWLGSWLAEDLQEVRLQLAADGFCWSHRSFNTSRCLSCAAGWLSFLLELHSNTQDAHRSRFHSAFVIHWLSCVPRGGQRLVRKGGFGQFPPPNEASLDSRRKEINTPLKWTWSTKCIKAHLHHGSLKHFLKSNLIFDFI